MRKYGNAMEYKLLKREEFSEYLPRIFSLYRASFNHDINENYLKWRYFENPLKDFFVQVVLDDGLLVAGSAMSPCMMNLHGISTKSAISLNAMVHPRYKGTGIYTKLHYNFYGRLVDGGYEFLIGFPNQLAHPITVARLGRKDIYEIPTMKLALERRTGSKKVTCETDHRFSMDYSGTSSFPLLNRIIKDSKYLQWRYSGDPVNKYLNFVIHNKEKVSSYMVIKQHLDRLNVIDFQPRDPAEGEYLLDTAISYAYSVNLNIVTTWAPRHTFYHSLAERKGFKNDIPITYFSMKELHNNILVSDNYSDWYIQQGDFYAY